MNPNAYRVSRRFVPIVTWISVLCGCLGCAAAIYISLPFLSVLPGAAIRPMSWFLYLTGIAFFTLVIGARCWLASRDSVYSRLASFGFVISLLPFPLGYAFMRIAARFGGFTIEP